MILRTVVVAFIWIAFQLFVGRVLHRSCREMCQSLASPFDMGIGVVVPKGLGFMIAYHCVVRLEKQSVARDCPTVFVVQGVRVKKTSQQFAFLFSFRSRH